MPKWWKRDKQVVEMIKTIFPFYSELRFNNKNSSPIKEISAYFSYQRPTALPSPKTGSNGLADSQPCCNGLADSGINCRGVYYRRYSGDKYAPDPEEWWKFVRRKGTECLMNLREEDMNLEKRLKIDRDDDNKEKY